MALSGPEEFQDWMRRRGFNQADAARFLDEEESFIHLIRTGKGSPGLRKAVKIERLSGIPVEAWITGPDEQPTLVAVTSGKRKLTK